MKVLVVGATGVLGRHTVNLLLAEGVPVRALTRRPASAVDLAAAGAEVIVGDLTVGPSLRRACAGIDRVLLAAHGALGRGRYRSEAVDDHGHRAILAAARTEGVARVVYVSAHGARHDHKFDFYRTKAAIEDCVQSCGVDFAILRPTAFMEWHAHAFNGKALLRNGWALLLGPGSKPRNFVAVRDVAGIAKELLGESAASGVSIDIGGPGNFTNDQVAALYAAEAAIPLRVAHVPRVAVRSLARVVRPFHPGIARAMSIAVVDDNDFDESYDVGRTTPSHRVGTTTLQDFVRERVAARIKAPD